MTKKKAVKSTEEVKKVKSTFDAKKEIHDVLDMIKNVTEILEQHQVLLDKIKWRLGI